MEILREQSRIENNRIEYNNIKIESILIINYPVEKMLEEVFLFWQSTLWQSVYLIPMTTVIAIFTIIRIIQIPVNSFIY